MSVCKVACTQLTTNRPIKNTVNIGCPLIELLYTSKNNNETIYMGNIIESDLKKNSKYEHINVTIRVILHQKLYFSFEIKSKIIGLLLY